MRFPASIALFLLTARAAQGADCVPINQARAHVGEVKCVSGKVLRVQTNGRGTHFLEFCSEGQACPFSVVVFAPSLRDVGDVRMLAGKTIEIRGAVKLYDGRAEIILSRVAQLSGGASMLPPVPKSYDVENRGRYSVGKFRPGPKPKKTKPAPGTSVTFGDEEGEKP